MVEFWRSLERFVVSIHSWLKKLFNFLLFVSSLQVHRLRCGKFWWSCWIRTLPNVLDKWTFFFVHFLCSEHCLFNGVGCNCFGKTILLHSERGRNASVLKWRVDGSVNNSGYTRVGDSQCPSPLVPHLVVESIVKIIIVNNHYFAIKGFDLPLLLCLFQ